MEFSEKIFPSTFTVHAPVGANNAPRLPAPMAVKLTLAPTLSVSARALSS